jgi:multiple sugar transport system permease protein
MIMQRLRRRLPRLLLAYGWLICISAFTAFPFVSMLSISFKSRPEMFSRLLALWPKQPTLDNYEYMLTKTDLPRYFLNSMKIGVSTTLLAVVLTTLSAYAISRFRFRFRRALATWLIAGQLLPGVITILPLFLVLARLGLVNTHIGLIIVDTVAALPFCTWMLKGYFDNVPVELEEAAMIDGCSRLGAIRRVFLPVAAPGVAAVALFAFTIAWQEYFFALVMLRDMDLRTLSVAITGFVGLAGAVSWGYIMATAVIIIVPALIIFVLLQRYMISGLTAGAVKG